MSIGSKFNLVALGIPVAILLAILGLIYWLAPNLFQPSLVLVGGFVALDGVVWNRLRSHLETKMHQVWDNYLKPIRDRVGEVVVGSSFFFPDHGWGLEQKVDWLSKWGKYGPLKLYPTKLVKLKLVSRLLPAGDYFNSELKRFLSEASSGLVIDGVHLELYHAFDRWGFRKIPLDQIIGLDSSVVSQQKIILDGLDRNMKKEIADLTQSWDKTFPLAKQIISLLDRFTSENAIMSPQFKNPFG
jgi:hypothetical protein